MHVPLHSIKSGFVSARFRRGRQLFIYTMRLFTDAAFHLEPVPFSILNRSWPPALNDELDCVSIKVKNCVPYSRPVDTSTGIR